jgi:hypothetical protein
MPVRRMVKDQTETWTDGAQKDGPREWPALCVRPRLCGAEPEISDPRILTAEAGPDAEAQSPRLGEFRQPTKEDVYCSTGES